MCLLLGSAVLLARSAGAAVLLLPIVFAHASVALLWFQFGRTMIPVAGPVVLWSSGTALAWWIRRYRPTFPER